MISPSIRTLFVSSSIFVTTIPQQQIICILLLLSYSSNIKCNASSLSARISSSRNVGDTDNSTSPPPSSSLILNDTSTAIDNVNNNSTAILEKYSQELTNQSALARKFDDIDLMPSIARTLFDPVKVYMSSVARNLIKAYTMFQWWEPELEFGSCMVQQRYKVDAKEAARGFVLNIVQKLFEKLRELFSMVSFESVKEEEEETPPIDFSYYERHPSVEKLAVHAAHAAVEHQINTQIPTRPPLIKFIPPRIRPNFGGLLNRRQGRTFSVDTKQTKEKEQLDVNYDKNDNLSIMGDENNDSSQKRVKRYRREIKPQRRRFPKGHPRNNPNIGNRIMNGHMIKRTENPRFRRQYHYNNPNFTPNTGGGVDPMYFNHAMTPSYNQPNPYTIQYTPHQMQNQQNLNQHLTYQEFHLPEDQSVDDYKGTLFDVNEYVDAKPISVDLQTTYTNWVDDFETIILRKFGLAERTNTHSGGYMECAQTYTWTLVLRFVETLVSKVLFR